MRKKPIEAPGKLLTQTRHLLMHRPASVTLSIIEADTSLPYPWLLTVLNDENARPAVNRVEKLHDYLVSKNNEVINVAS